MLSCRCTLPAADSLLESLVLRWLSFPRKGPGTFRTSLVWLVLTVEKKSLFCGRTQLGDNRDRRPAPIGADVALPKCAAGPCLCFGEGCRRGGVQDEWNPSDYVFHSQKEQLCFSMCAWQQSKMVHNTSRWRGPCGQTRVLSAGKIPNFARFWRTGIDRILLGPEFRVICECRPKLTCGLQRLRLLPFSSTPLWFSQWGPVHLEIDSFATSASLMLRNVIVGCDFLDGERNISVSGNPCCIARWFCLFVSHPSAIRPLGNWFQVLYHLCSDAEKKYFTQRQCIVALLTRMLPKKGHCRAPWLWTQVTQPSVCVIWSMLCAGNLEAHFRKRYTVWCQVHNVQYVVIPKSLIGDILTDDLEPNFVFISDASARSWQFDCDPCSRFWWRNVFVKIAFWFDGLLHPSSTCVCRCLGKCTTSQSLPCLHKHEWICGTILKSSQRDCDDGTRGCSLQCSLILLTWWSPEFVVRREMWLVWSASVFFGAATSVVLNFNLENWHNKFFVDPLYILTNALCVENRF